MVVPQGARSVLAGGLHLGTEVIKHCFWFWKDAAFGSRQLLNHIDQFYGWGRTSCFRENLVMQWYNKHIDQSFRLPRVLLLPLGPRSA